MVSVFVDRRHVLAFGAALTGGFAVEFAQATAADGGSRQTPALRAQFHRGVWSRFGPSRPASSIFLIMRQDLPTVRLSCSCTVSPTTFTPTSMSPRCWPPKAAASSCHICVARPNAFSRSQDAAFGRTGGRRCRDLIALIDALGIKRAVFAGYDWGGRAACVGAALWPDRCAGLVTVNGYLIQNIARAMIPATPMHEVAYWYQYYFQIERGRAGLAADRREIAKILWRQWSPNWHFDDATFGRTAQAFDNPDYVDVVIHSYRHRYGLAEGDPRYAELERHLAAQPMITVPAITLDGDADGVAPPTDGSSSAAKFSNRRAHHVVPHAGHNLPQEEPEAFAAAVTELIKA